MKPDAAPEPQDAVYWNRRANHVARAVNIAWWLDTLAFPVVAGSVAGAAAVLIIRNQAAPPSTTTILITAGIVVLTLAAIALLRARRKFETPDRSMVRIEAALGMHNALSAARAGVAPWPPPHTFGSAAVGLRWQWKRLAMPPLAALAIVAAALWIPVGRSDAAHRATPQQPPAWERIDAELDALAETAVVDETYLEETRDRLEQLRSAEPEQWFSHASMEATDGLARSHRNETRRMEEEMDRAGRAIDQLEKLGADAAPEAFAAQADEFQQAIDGMRNGDMKPNAELLEKLSKLDPDALKNLDPGQLRELQQQLKDAADALRNACENGACDGLGDGPPGLAGEDGEPGDPGNNPSGQPGEDGGHVPGLLGENPGPDAGTGTPEALAAQDLSRAGLGDLLEIRQGEHDPDDIQTSPLHGGGTADAGRGGDRIWRDSLDPGEQRAIRRFFE